MMASGESHDDMNQIKFKAWIFDIIPIMFIGEWTDY